MPNDAGTHHSQTPIPHPMKTQLASIAIASVVLCGCTSSTSRKPLPPPPSTGDYLVISSIDTSKKADFPTSVDSTLGRSLEFTIGKEGSTSGDLQHAILIYTICKRDFDGRIIAKAIDARDREIGRCILPVRMTTDQASYLQFTFPAEMDPAQIRRYSIAPAAAKPTQPATPTPKP